VAIGYLLAWWAAGLVGLCELRARRTFAFTTGIQNYSYFPLPLIFTLFGRETTGVLFGYAVGVDLCLWTIGLMMLTGKGGWAGIRQAFNLPVVVIILALVLNLLGAGAWIPQWVDKTWGMLGACAVPFALLLTGASFADSSAPRQFWRGKSVMAASALVRVGIMPLLILAVGLFLPVGDDLQKVLIVQAAMPAAVAPMAIARHYGGDATVGLQVVLSSTVISLATIPLWLQLGLSWLPRP
jgi:predicted permease